MYCNSYFRLEGCMCWAQFFVGYLGSMNGLSTTVHISSKRHFPLCWLQDQATNILFVSVSDMQ